MRVLFSEDFDWTPPAEPHTTVAHRAGYEYTVPHLCGEAAVKAGKAKAVPVPPRDPLDHDNNGRKGGASKPKADAEA